MVWVSLLSLTVSVTGLSQKEEHLVTPLSKCSLFDSLEMGPTKPISSPRTPGSFPTWAVLSCEPHPKTSWGLLPNLPVWYEDQHVLSWLHPGWVELFSVEPDHQQGADPTGLGGVGGRLRQQD